MLTQSFYCRLRSSRASGCRCGDSKTDGDGQGLELSDNLNQLKNSSEVYDNPNYSHIMIGGQPFFILPSGELSEHVPVPSSGELLTPRQTEAQHIYEGGGSTSYRSTSDYDTDSSTYRPESDRASNGFPPIYEEIDSSSVRRRGGEVVGVVRGPVSPVSGMAVMQRREGESLPGVVMLQGRPPPATLQREERLQQPWQGHKSLSPRRPASRLPARPANNSSVYYYSDTLKRRGLGGLEETGRDSLHESDSGVSSRSGHNTSSESTPQPLGGEMGRSFRRTGQGGPRPPPTHLVSSSEDFQQESPARVKPGTVETQIVVRNTTKREPIVKL